MDTPELNHQTVTLDEQDTFALFTESGRVFFDLDILVSAYAPLTMHNQIIALAQGDDRGVNDADAQAALLSAILDTKEALIANYQMSQMTDDDIWLSMRGE